MSGIVSVPGHGAPRFCSRVLPRIRSELAVLGERAITICLDEVDIRFI